MDIFDKINNTSLTGHKPTSYCGARYGTQQTTRYCSNLPDDSIDVCDTPWWNDDLTGESATANCWPDDTRWDAHFVSFVSVHKIITLYRCTATCCNMLFIQGQQQTRASFLQPHACYYQQESLANAKVSVRQPCWSKTDFDMICIYFDMYWRSFLLQSITARQRVEYRHVILLVLSVTFQKK